MTSDARKRQAEKVSHNHGIDPSCGEHPVGACLVVIDPDNRTQLQRILNYLIDAHDWVFFDDEETLDHLAGAVRSLNIPQPRLPEPAGLGAVVEDDRGDLWVRVKGDSWACGLSRREWVNIDATRVLSDGVQP